MADRDKLRRKTWPLSDDDFLFTLNQVSLKRLSDETPFIQTGSNMAYDEILAQRVYQLLKRRAGFSQRKMFGGICFMLHGNMCCGITQHELMLRLGEKNALKALETPYTREMDFTGKPLKSMIYVEQPGFEDDESLRYWVNQAVKFVQSLPPKS